MLRGLKVFVNVVVDAERSPAIVSLGLLTILSLAGCSDQPAVYPVRGRVMMSDGTPLSFGLLEFRNTSMKLNARARIQVDGSYQMTTFEKLDGAVAGTHRAIVVQHVMAEVARPRKQIQEQEAGSEQHRQHRIVDPKFASYETSPLVLEVEAKSENVIDIRVF